MKCFNTNCITILIKQGVIKNQNINIAKGQGLSFQLIDKTIYGIYRSFYFLRLQAF